MQVDRTIAGEPSPATARLRSWAAGFVTLVFILLQSLCTVVLSISGLSALIGVGSLTAAGWLLGPLGAIHGDVIRVPMMALAATGAAANLYVLWRVRSLRARPASQWRAQVVPASRSRAEMAKIVLSVATLILVACEVIAHRIVQHHF